MEPQEGDTLRVSDAQGRWLGSVSPSGEVVYRDGATIGRVDASGRIFTHILGRVGALQPLGWVDSAGVVWAPRTQGRWRDDAPDCVAQVSPDGRIVDLHGGLLGTVEPAADFARIARAGAALFLLAYEERLLDPAAGALGPLSYLLGVPALLFALVVIGWLVVAPVLAFGPGGLVCSGLWLAGIAAWVYLGPLTLGRYVRGRRSPRR